MQNESPKPRRLSTKAKACGLLAVFALGGLAGYEAKKHELPARAYQSASTALIESTSYHGKWKRETVTQNNLPWNIANRYPGNVDYWIDQIDRYNVRNGGKPYERMVPGDQIWVPDSKK